MKRDTIDQANEILKKIEYIQKSREIYERELNVMIDNRNPCNSEEKTELKERLLKILFSDLDDDIEALEDKLEKL